MARLALRARTRGVSDLDDALEFIVGSSGNKKETRISRLQISKISCTETPCEDEYERNEIDYFRIFSKRSGELFLLNFSNNSLTSFCV